MSRLLAVLAAVALACALLAPSAGAATFGFNDNAIAWGQLTASRDTSLALAAGATTTRITFDWRWAEQTKGVFQMSKYDAIYNANIGKGIRPVFVLLFAPQWAWADGTPCVQATADCRYPPGPSHLDAWRNVVKKLVTRYPKMAGLEIWNEPNLAQFWQGGFDPAFYTTLVKEAHATVRAAHSTVPVLGGALASVNDGDESYSGSSSVMSYRKFVKGMYDAGVKGNMEALSLHPYPDDRDLGRYYKMLTEVRDARDAAGDTVPLAVTELGISTVGQSGDLFFNNNDQAALLSRIYRELQSPATTDVSTVMIHTLVDPTLFPATDKERGFGVLDIGLTPKRAYCELAAINRTSYQCPATVPALTHDATQDARWDAQQLVQAAVDAARRYRRAHGSFAGLTAADLHALDPRLSDQPADGTQLPGADADPSRILVSVWGATDQLNLLLCNDSRADSSYCVLTSGTSGVWTYGSTTSSMNGTAGAVIHGQVWWW